MKFEICLVFVPWLLVISPSLLQGSLYRSPADAEHPGQFPCILPAVKEPQYLPVAPFFKLLPFAPWLIVNAPGETAVEAGTGQLANFHKINLLALNGTTKLAHAF